MLSARPGEVVANCRASRAPFFRHQHTTKPLLVAAVGALFAFSFDTMSQAARSLTATQFGGWEHALTLALLFMLGMLVGDGLNGLWISRLIRRADRTALIASRVMGLVVAGVSLLVATFGAAKFFSGSRCLERRQGTAFGLVLGRHHRCQLPFAVRGVRRPQLI